MSHREEPRSGRGCFGAVVIVPFLALGGMFALVALTGSPSENPLGAPVTTRPTKTSMWWTEPLDTPVTVVETVVVEGKRRDMRGNLLATSSRASTTDAPPAGQSTSTRPSPTGRSETPTSEPEPTEPTEPSAPPEPTGSSEPPNPTMTVTSEPSVPSEPPTSQPEPPSSTEVPTTSTPCPRSETPTPVPSPSETSGTSEPTTPVPTEGS